MPVMRLGRKGVWHVVHETRTAEAPRGHGFAICWRPGEFLPCETRPGVPTCVQCVNLDDPTGMSDDAKRALLQGGTSSPDARQLLKRDYIDRAGGLTRRGHLIALDFNKEPAPWPDEHGVVHRRLPLSANARCGRGPIAFPDPLTTERYGSLREIAPAVTCLFCARIP